MGHKRRPCSDPTARLLTKVILRTVSCPDLLDLYGTSHSLYSVAADKAEGVHLGPAARSGHG